MMSDTPLDVNLTAKRSTRFPPFFMSRLEEFREEYNDTIRSIESLGEDEQETFILDSKSEAHRRLIDLGMAYWVENGAPFGFSFEPGDFATEAEQSLYCPECGETDAWLFRIAVGDTEDEHGFGTIKCLSCGHMAENGDFFTPSL